MTDVQPSTDPGWGLGPEEEFLCALVATGIGAGSPPPVPPALDASRLLTLVTRHKVQGLVAAGLARHPDLVVPASVRQEIAVAQRTNAMLALRSTLQTVRVADALRGRGISVVPLKGVCLALLYFGDVAARAAGDIDLLIEKADFAQADRIIRDLGFVRLNAETKEVLPDDHVAPPDFSQHAVYAGSDATLIELHFRLHKNPILLPLGVPDILAQAQAVRLGGTDLPVMSDEHQFLFLVTHGARHMWKRLQWVADIAVLVRRCGLGAAEGWLQAAGRFGLTSTAVQAFVLAHELLGAPLPPSAERLMSGLAARTLVSRARGTIFRSLVEEPDDPGGFDMGVRFYRMCMSTSPRYHWHEMARTVQVLADRVRGRQLT